MTGNSIKMEIRSGPERRRRWSTAEKLGILHETYETDATVSLSPVVMAENDLVCGCLPTTLLPTM